MPIYGVERVVRRERAYVVAGSAAEAAQLAMSIPDDGWEPCDGAPIDGELPVLDRVFEDLADGALESVWVRADYGVPPKVELLSH